MDTFEVIGDLHIVTDHAEYDPQRLGPWCEACAARICDGHTAMVRRTIIVEAYEKIDFVEEAALERACQDEVNAMARDDWWWNTPPTIRNLSEESRDKAKFAAWQEAVKGWEEGTDVRTFA